MHLEIWWAARARIELSKITVFVAQRDPSRAATLRAQIFERMEALQENPFISSVYCFVPSVGEVREISVGTYRVFFTVDEAKNLIHVRRIRHVRQADPDFEE